MVAERIRRTLGLLDASLAAWAVMAGTLGGLGRPGLPFPLLYIVSVGALCYFAARTERVLGAIACGACWGLGLFPVVTVGALSWGWPVPVFFTLFGVAGYATPLSSWAWWASRRLAPVSLFVSTTLAWSLWMELGDLAEFPWKGDVTALLAFAPALVGGARLVGSNLVSGIIIASVLTAVATLLRNETRGRRRSLVLVPLAAGVALLGCLSLLGRGSSPSADRTIWVGVAQPNADHIYYQSRVISPHVVTEFDGNMARLLSELDEIDLLVLTESFDGKYGLLLPPLLERWQARANQRRQAILLTSYLVEPNGWKSNAVGGIDSAGRLVGIHRKVDLAPFGETPLVAGSDYHVLAVGDDTRVGPLICRESCLPSASHRMTRDGANLLVASTSDVTFFSSVLPFEHLAITQLRAIETGRTVVWASNAGPSCIIDRDGVPHDTTPFRQPAALRAKADLHSDITPYLRLKGAFLVASLLGLLVLLTVSHLSRAAPLGLAPAAPSRLELAGKHLVGGVALVAALLLSAVISVTSAAIVDFTHGRRGHAARAISEMLAPPSAPEIGDPYARFRTSKEASLAGTIAYFLTYYGIEMNAGDIAVSGVATLEEVQELLEIRYHVGTKLLYVGTDLPRVAAIVQLVDGSYAVALNAFGEPNVTFFLPAEGKNLLVGAMQAPGMVRRAMALIPAMAKIDGPTNLH